MWRMEKDAAGEEDWTTESKQQSMADGFETLLKDPQNWILVVIVYGAAGAIATDSFFPTVVAGMGHGRIVRLLLTAPPYLLACITCAAVAWNADRTQERCWHTVIPITCALAGFIISAAVAFNNALSTICSIYGPYLYPNDVAPRFVLAFSVNSAMALVAILASTLLHFYLKRENKELEVREREEEAAGHRPAGGGFRYLT